MDPPLSLYAGTDGTPLSHSSATASKTAMDPPLSLTRASNDGHGSTPLSHSLGYAGTDGHAMDPPLSLTRQATPVQTAMDPPLSLTRQPLLAQTAMDPPLSLTHHFNVWITVKLVLMMCQAHSLMKYNHQTCFVNPI